MSPIKFLAIIPLLCIGCAPALPCKTVAYKSPNYFAPHTHLVWCKGEASHCFKIAGTFCSGATSEGDKQHSEPGRWHQIAVGTNVPVMTKEGDGYSFWIVCDDERD
jgi:hypothetical protein